MTDKELDAAISFATEERARWDRRQACMWTSFDENLWQAARAYRELRQLLRPLYADMPDCFETDDQKRHLAKTRLFSMYNNPRVRELINGA